MWPPPMWHYCFSHWSYPKCSPGQASWHAWFLPGSINTFSSCLPPATFIPKTCLSVTIQLPFSQNMFHNPTPPRNPPESIPLQLPPHSAASRGWGTVSMAKVIINDNINNVLNFWQVPGTLLYISHVIFLILTPWEMGITIPNLQRRAEARVTCSRSHSY